MKPPINQVVGYVAPPAKPGEAPSIKKGVVMMAYNDEADTAQIDLTPRNAGGAAADPENAPIGHHTALAAFNADKKTENTWHPLEAPATAAPKPQPVAARPAA
jgi:hypothetical protein